MRAKDRKRAQELLDQAPAKKVKKLREAFETKGFLSKRELKILNRIAGATGPQQDSTSLGGLK